MPSVRVQKELNDQTYFITMTVRRWYYLFDRYQRWEILANSIRYCQENKDLKTYGYVFMLNHIHLIIQAPDVGGFIRDFKKFTANQMIKNLRETEPRLLRLFQLKDGPYEFWQKTNMPQLIESDEFFEQKLNYIHNNPVKKQYVENPEHWIWSSASHYYEAKEGRIKVDELWV